MNENNKKTSSRWDEFLSRLKARTIALRTFPSERVVKVVVKIKKKKLSSKKSE
ncbi:MAG: hypothetical protein UHX00_05745 [Caryophanon sp.]|nr:hypothetical protein [Caryophanon sp.]